MIFPWNLVLVTVLRLRTLQILMLSVVTPPTNEEQFA